MAYEVGTEVVIVAANGILDRLVGWRAVVTRIADNGKLDIWTGNERRLVSPNQVEHNAAE